MGKMYRIVVQVLTLICLYSCPIDAYELDYEKIYILRLPDWEISGADYSKKFKSHKVRLSKVDNLTFKITPIEKYKYEKWLKSGDEQETRGWIGNINSDNLITIPGLMVIHEFYAFFELKGRFVNTEAIKGNAVIRVGMGPPGKTPFVYRSEWVLEPGDTEEPLMISDKVTYHGPPVKTIKATTSTPEEEAKRPITDDTGIKLLAKYEPRLRERFYKRMVVGSREKAYYDTLLTEFTWDELKHTPGILLLIDHLGTLDEEDQRRIAEGYVRDGSIDFFGDIPYTELQQVPPLFLILKSIDQMNESDIAGLKSSSLRFLKMLEAYQQIPPNELADTALDDFLVRVSEELPIELRKTYYRSSPKLRAYVEISEDSRLRVLYPFQSNKGS